MRLTGVKWLAAVEKKAAEPPSTSCCSPNGVLTVSSATDPTTRSFSMAGPYAPFFGSADGPSKSDTRLRVSAGIWRRGVSTAVSGPRAQEHGRAPVKVGATVWVLARD